jgi:hypothetical protein
MVSFSGEQGFDRMATERDLFDIDHCQTGAWLREKVPFLAELCTKW